MKKAGYMIVSGLLYVLILCGLHANTDEFDL